MLRSFFVNTMGKNTSVYLFERLSSKMCTISYYQYFFLRLQSKISRTKTFRSNRELRTAVNTITQNICF